MTHHMIGHRGIELVKRFEGCKLEAYLCPAGVLTIGYGTTRGVHPGMKITQEDAERFLVDDLKIAETAVNRAVKARLTQAMFDALVSWTFNLGAGNLGASTMLTVLNRPGYLRVPEQMCRWIMADGKESLGLARRRVAEAALFLEDGLP